jgi:two-component system response regulator PilR (NtrC family)
VFELADQGSIFLDEISEMTPGLQAKLLRVIEDKSFRKVGGEQELKVDVRIIAATNRDIEKEIKTGRFREDLFYRLNVIHIHLPPLRERKEDIPILAQHFLEKYSAEMKKPIRKISKEAEEMLIKYHWPGNVRELENVIERAVSMEKTEAILPESITEKVRCPENVLDLASSFQIPSQGINLEKTMENLERKMLKEALLQSRGNQTRAAELLGLSFRSFRYRIKKLGIDQEMGLKNEDEEKEQEPNHSEKN